MAKGLGEHDKGSKTPASVATPEPPKIPNAPGWWKHLAPTTTNTYDASVNALLPYLAPEDQATVAKYLSGTQTALADYADIRPPTPKATPGSPSPYQYFMSSGRAQQAMSALQNVGITSGAGYTYLKSVLQTMQRLGGNGGQITRANYQELVSAVNALSTQASTGANAGELKKYVTLANYLVNPTISRARAAVGENTSTNTGRTIYGRPNVSLYG